MKLPHSTGRVPLVTVYPFIRMFVYSGYPLRVRSESASAVTIRKSEMKELRKRGAKAAVDIQ